MHAKLKSALPRLGCADAIGLQSIVSEELAQGLYVAAERDSNPRPFGRRIFQ